MELLHCVTSLPLQTQAAGIRIGTAGIRNNLRPARVMRKLLLGIRSSKFLKIVRHTVHRHRGDRWRARWSTKGRRGLVTFTRSEDATGEEIFDAFLQSMGYCQDLRLAMPDPQ